MYKNYEKIMGHLLWDCTAVVLTNNDFRRDVPKARTGTGLKAQLHPKLLDPISLPVTCLKDP